MLFNSLEFLYVFLPITIVLFFALGKLNRPQMAQRWLVVASLIFYGWWNPKNLPFLLFSVIFNYSLGRVIRDRKWLFVFGLAVNVGILVYFKYSAFIIKSVLTFWGRPPEFIASSHALPLGISFFTFTQIAFLTDCYTGIFQKFNLTEYSLFVATFPHLIAGPIVYAEQLIPQFRQKTFLKPNPRNILVGLAIFGIGLLKKVFVADSLAALVNPIFKLTDAGHSVSSTLAWAGAFAYTLQIYFDFSAYSEMAVGLGLLFNMKLQANFLSPYKSKNISEFWRRWHISLSDFLRIYLFNPLVMAMGRRGNPRMYTNLLITMTVAGMWHGAAWNFIFWGFLHGIFLVTHRIWESLSIKTKSWPLNLWAPLLTTLTVTVSFVFFRATTWGGAWRYLRCLFDKENGHYGLAFISSQVSGGLQVLGKPFLGTSSDLFWLVAIGIPLLWIFVWTAPNVMTLLKNYIDNAIYGDKKLLGKVSLPLGLESDWKGRIALAMLTAFAVVIGSYQIYCHGETPFIYFEF